MSSVSPWSRSASVADEVSAPTVSAGTRYAVVLIDGLAVLVPFLASLLPGVATLAGATGGPDWLGVVLALLGPALGAGVLIGNGGVLAGRGQSLAMAMLDVSLVDAHGGHPVGTSRAFTHALLSLVIVRLSDGPSYAENQAHAMLVPGLPGDRHSRI